jgi:hypothetical protein
MYSVPRIYATCYLILENKSRKGSVARRDILWIECYNLPNSIISATARPSGLFFLLINKIYLLNMQ